MREGIDFTITFCREYYTKQFGKEFLFDEQFFLDANKRIQIESEMQRKIHQRFGVLGLGCPGPEPRINIGFDDTLNITAMFGGKVTFTSGYTWLEPNSLATDEQLEALTVPNIAETWPHTLFIQQYEQAVKKCSPENVTVPAIHGILESCLDLRGEQFLVDLLEKPRLSEEFLDVILETTIAVKEFWDKKKFGQVQKKVIVQLGGCSSMLVSPATFERYLLPRYNLLTRRCGPGHLCCCGAANWQLENFAKMENMATYRLGWETDFRKARKILGDRKICASLDPARIANADVNQVERDLRRLIEETGEPRNLRILLINAAAETPDANIRAIIATIEKHSTIK